MPKKKTYNNAVITFRLPMELKTQFINSCEQIGEHYQTKIRKMIKEFVDTPIKDLEKKKHEEYLKNQRLL